MPDIEPVLSHFQAQPLLDARKTGVSKATTSLDLGLSTVPVELNSDGVVLPGGVTVTWEDIDDIVRHPNACFRVEAGSVAEIRVFSEHTGWVRSLMPTVGAPTMLVSGVPMHRIQNVDPYEDTRRKMKTIAPVGGVVLDTATGLGYTAIEAAKTAERVVTIELDPAGLEIARENPWSRALFDNPRIEQVIGDSYDEVTRLADSTFSRVIHDPPALALAGDLYSGAFYRELHRILKRNGRLFHYIGDPESASGRNTTRGVMRRLQESGFSRIVRRPEAFGVVAYP